MAEGRSSPTLFEDESSDVADHLLDLLDLHLDISREGILDHVQRPLDGITHMISVRWYKASGAQQLMTSSSMSYDDYCTLEDTRVAQGRPMCDQSNDIGHSDDVAQSHAAEHGPGPAEHGLLDDEHETANKSNTHTQKGGRCWAHDRDLIQIQKDLGRTTARSCSQPMLRTFLLRADAAATAARLSRLLVAFASRNPHPGYAQGMSYIALFLLAFYEREEQAFWVFCAIIERLRLEDTYSPPPAAMRGLMIQRRVLCYTASAAFPELLEVGGEVEYGLEEALELVSAKWLVPLFFDTLDLLPCILAWDAFFRWGDAGLVTVALAIIHVAKPDILGGQDCYVSLLGAAREMTAAELEAGLANPRLQFTTATIPSSPVDNRGQALLYCFLDSTLFATGSMTVFRHAFRAYYASSLVEDKAAPRLPQWLALTDAWCADKAATAELVKAALRMSKAHGVAQFPTFVDLVTIIGAGSASERIKVLFRYFGDWSSDARQPTIGSRHTLVCLSAWLEKLVTLDEHWADPLHTMPQPLVTKDFSHLAETHPVLRQHLRRALCAPSPHGTCTIYDDDMRQSTKTTFLFENQRWTLMHGFSSALLSYDPPSWEDPQGRPCRQEEVQPPPCWSWEGPEWTLELGFGTDPDGWTYSQAFRGPFGDCHSSSVVRRRRWTRTLRNMAVVTMRVGRLNKEQDDLDDGWLCVEALAPTKAVVVGRRSVSAYQHERWMPMRGYCGLLLPSDPNAWSDIKGVEARLLDSFVLQAGWQWEAPWQVWRGGKGTTTGAATLDTDGWQYAEDFHNSFGPATLASCVRRRKWERSKIKVVHVPLADDQRYICR